MSFLRYFRQSEDGASPRPKIEYHLVHDPDEHTRPQPAAKSITSWTILMWVLCVSNFLLFATSLFNLSRSSSPLCTQGDGQEDERFLTDLNSDLKRISSYSPIFDALDLNPKLHRFNGAVNDNSSIFRQDPSPEVDAAWDALSAEGFEITTTSSSAVFFSNKDPTLSVKAPLSWGRGNDAYVVQIDVFHQIHCLNELRKEIHFDYYYKDQYGGGGDNVPPEHHIHKKHCLHILLQNLLCHADVDMIPHNWVHYQGLDQPHRPWAEPLADFNAVKKCRDFDALLDWAKQTAVSDLPTKWADLKYPDGAPVLDGSSGYFKNEAA